MRPRCSKIRPEHPNLPEHCYPHMVRRPVQQTHIRTELELISSILGHSSTEATRIYAVPSMKMMCKAMEFGNMSTDEKPLFLNFYELHKTKAAALARLP